MAEHSANSQPFGGWDADAEENRTDKGKGRLGKDTEFGQDATICLGFL